MHTGHLGSLNCFTSESGALEQEMSFDAWGRRRNPTNWSYTGVPTTHIIDRGFTGHEHLDGFGLINMNGRMYDPVTGRFLSPDNQVQAPDNTQSYNRYTYCLNNPLKYTDPSGWDNEGQYTNYWEYFNTHNAFNFGSSGPASTIGLSNQEWMNATNPGRDNPDYQQMVAFNRQNAYTMAGVAQYVYDRNHSFTLSVNGEYLGRVYVVPGLSVNIDIDIYGVQNGEARIQSPQQNQTNCSGPGIELFPGGKLYSKEDEAKAYKDIHRKGLKANIEVHAWILKEGILVLPTIGNTCKDGDFYALETNTLGIIMKVQYDNKWYNITGSLHLHPDTYNARLSGNDYYLLNKFGPIFVMSNTQYYGQTDKHSVRGSVTDLFNGTSLINNLHLLY